MHRVRQRRLPRDPPLPSAVLSHPARIEIARRAVTFQTGDDDVRAVVRQYVDVAIRVLVFRVLTLLDGIVGCEVFLRRMWLLVLLLFSTTAEEALRERGRGGFRRMCFRELRGGDRRARSDPYLLALEEGEEDCAFV